MDAASYLRCFRREMAAFRDCVAARDLAAPIAYREEFDEPLDLAGLAARVGQANLFAAACVSDWTGGDAPPDGAPAVAPSDRYELLRWLEGTGEVLIMSLDLDPDTPAWGHFTPPKAGYWQRSVAVGTMLHRWDAEQAFGEPGRLDPALAGAGVSEVFEVLAPRMIGRGKAWPPDACVRLEATDTGDWWAFGPGDPVAELRGTAADLLLLLRGRRTTGDPVFDWEGDRAAALSVLKGPLALPVESAARRDRARAALPPTGGLHGEAARDDSLRCPLAGSPHLAAGPGPPAAHKQSTEAHGSASHWSGT